MTRIPQTEQEWRILQSQSTDPRQIAAIAQILERERTKDRGASVDLQAANAEAAIYAYTITHALKSVEEHLRHTFDADTSRKSVASLALDVAAELSEELKARKVIG